MLILTRKTGQSFQIGDDIKITITEVSGDKVKIGIDAPRELHVLREELCKTVETNMQAVTGVSGDALRALAANLKGFARPEGSDNPGNSRDKDPD